MWKWLLSTPSWILSGFAWILKFWGIPGFIDDTTWWVGRYQMIPDLITYFLIGSAMVVTGPLVWTSGWWWPRLRGKLRPVAVPTDDTGVIATSVADEATQHYIEAFTALLPIIERHRWACQPMTFKNMGIMPVMRAFPEFAADHQQLIATLDALGICTPEDDASIVDWHYYLIGLRLRVLTGNIEEARSFYINEEG